MQRPSGLRPSVLAAKQRLAESREKMRVQQQNGSPGFQVCAGLADATDAVILDLFESALDDLDRDHPTKLRSQVTLVPHGGYGRRDLAPFSDIDLMLLYAPSAKQRVVPLAQRLIQDIGDSGLQLGFSSRSTSDVCRLAWKDPVIFSSLAESRYLAGSVSQFTRFSGRFRRGTKRRSRSLVQAVYLARREERRQYGDTVYLLRPNLKKSRGGLRDIQLVRWVGFARYGECDLHTLYQIGALSKADRNKLREAAEFLLHLRNEMHFHAGRAEDVLQRGEQVRLAELYNYSGREGLLPVEQFMRDYFEHTGNVRYVAKHFVASARGRTGVARVFGPLMSHLVERDFLVGPLHINATRRGIAKLRGDLAQVLRLMDLANLFDKRIGHDTWQTIRESMSDSHGIELSDEARQRFLSLMSQPAQLGEMLRRLHQLRALERIIPPMQHARSLLQFNEYHKYTVDEHSIRAVQCATEFQDDPGLLGAAYRDIRNKRTIHMALLLHDMGKGFPEDHSEVGLRLAEQTATHLKLPEQESETLKFLVHKHLLMSHLAFRRDIDDQSIVVQFAVEVGSPDVLQMLYVLTCADLAAVGPGVLNQWKKNLLAELYRRTMHHLAGNGPEFGAWQEERRSKLKALAQLQEQGVRLVELVEELPANYLHNTTPEQAIEELNKVQCITPQDAFAWGRFVPERNAVQYTIATHEKITPGVFYRLTGVLTSMGQEILGAEINTLPGGLVLDRFYVNDLDFAGSPPAERLEDVQRALVCALKSPSDEPPRFRRLWQAGENDSESSEVQRLPSRVKIDNDTSESYTIIDVFTHDRRGLLYDISRTLYELGLSVSVAKIGTYLDQVVDVFYVTDSDGHKIEARPRIREIRDRLLAAVQVNSPNSESMQPT